MTGFFSRRWIAPVMALAMPCLAGPSSAIQAGEFPFRASGTWAVSLHGSHLEGTRSGLASPGGPFVGVFSGKQTGNGRASGVGMLDFGGGDTLTYVWQVEFDAATGLLLGSGVVSGGTGRLEDASGSWSSIGVPTGDGTGTFEYAGTLSY